jgi:ribosomal protein S24E
MSNTSCTLRTRKFMTNRLLSRRQFVSARFPDSHPGGS